MTQDLPNLTEKSIPKTKHPLYYLWHNVIRRCLDPRMSNYASYGGRGIMVCDRWKNDFWSFVEDIGPRPSAKHTLDRRNNSLGYEPSNCRWANPKEQVENSSHAVFLEHNGERLILKDWARKSNQPYHRLYARYRRGWPIEKILSTESLGGAPRNPNPNGEYRPKSRKSLTMGDVTMTVKEWSELLQIPMIRIRWRLQHGWTVERTLNTPFKRNRGKSQLKEDYPKEYLKWKDQRKKQRKNNTELVSFEEYITTERLGSGNKRDAQGKGC